MKGWFRRRLDLVIWDKEPEPEPTAAPLSPEEVARKALRRHIELRDEK